MNSDRSTVILWDLDGTIISAGSNPREPFELALRSLDRELPQRLPELHGKTDLAVCRDYLQLTRLSELHERGQAQQLLREVEHVTVARSGTLLADRRVLPGVVEVLHAIRERGVRQVLATGSSRIRAEQKLRVCGMSHWFELSLSAFGDETTERAELVRLAGNRNVVSRGFDTASASPTRFVVIGDTPSDVVAARLVGFPIVGVASGTFSKAELCDAGADLAVSSLDEEGKAALRFVFGE